MTNGSDYNSDFAVLYDNQGNDGETVFRYPSKPQVQVLEGDVSTDWDESRGDLRLNYVHNGLARVLVQYFRDSYSNYMRIWMDGNRQGSIGTVGAARTGAQGEESDLGSRRLPTG